jgi:hypothetical protein
MAARASESFRLARGTLQLCAALLLGCGPADENLPPVQIEGDFLTYAANEEVCDGTVEYGELWMTSVAARMGISEEEILPTTYYQLTVEEANDRCGSYACTRIVDGEIQVFAPAIFRKHEMVHAIHLSAWPQRRALLTEGLAKLFADNEPHSFEMDGPSIDIDEQIEKEQADSQTAIVGSRIVYWIVQRHGIDAFREFWHADTMKGSAEEFRALFEQHFGESLDAMLADVAGQPACPLMTCVGDVVEWEGEVWTIESPKGCNDGSTMGNRNSELIRTVLMEVPEAGTYTVSISENTDRPQGASIYPCAGPCSTQVTHGHYLAGRTDEATWEAGLYRVTTYKMDATDPGVRVEIRPK